MVILNTGTIGTSSTAVAGVGTTFTQLVGPDYQTVLTGTGQDIEVAAELITGIPSIANTQQPWGYVIKSIASDTAMTAYTPIAPALASGTAYVLATIPDIPDTHQFAIASLATRNMMVTPGEDSRYTVWAGIAERDVQKLRDVVMERQIQEQVGRRRFPYGFARRGRFYGP
jgi:hypothetical protein